MRLKYSMSCLKMKTQVEQTGRSQSMIRTVLLIFVFTISVVFTSQVHAQKQEKLKGPLIELQKDIHEFGKVRQDTIVSHVFTFKNAGSDTLYVAKIGSS
ncbi:MAG: DUF1573 domain-containing protein [Caldithrix sp.]|nr:DUF1573 domain-containing protein [Caldithrix sp.]